MKSQKVIVCALFIQSATFMKAGEPADFSFMTPPSTLRFKKLGLKDTPVGTNTNNLFTDLLLRFVVIFRFSQNLTHSVIQSVNKESSTK